MYARIESQLGVKGRSHVPALLHQNRIVAVPGQYVRLRPDLANDRRSNEDGLQIVAPAFRMDFSDVTVQLPTISVAFHGHVHQAERSLQGILHMARQQDRAGARTEDGLLLAEGGQRFPQIFQIQQFQHGRAFAAGDDQGVDRIQLAGGANRHSVCANALQGILVGFKIALERQHANGFLTSHEFAAVRLAESFRSPDRTCQSPALRWLPAA